MGANSRCSIQRCFAHADDKEVLGKVHNYDTVDRHIEILPRNFCFEPGDLQPPLTDKKMNKDVKELNLRSIMGYGPAGWFSPCATRSFLPFVDIITGRAANMANTIPLLKNDWLCRLISRRMVVRKKGSKLWFIGMGDICASVAAVWPLVLESFGTFVPITEGPTARTQFLTIMDLTKWEAMAVEVVSP